MSMPNYVYVFTNHSELIFTLIDEESVFCKEFVYKSPKSEANAFNHKTFMSSKNKMI